MRVRLLLLVLPLVACSGAETSLQAAGDFESRLVLESAAGGETRAFRRGEVIRLSLSVRNTAAEPRTLPLRTSQTHDFSITSSTGEEIWRWSRGRMFAQVLTELRFEPGESKRFEVQWDQRRADGTPAAAGHYQATGQIPTTLAGIPSAAETLSVR